MTQPGLITVSATMIRPTGIADRTEPMRPFLGINMQTQEGGPLHVGSAR